MVDSTAVRWESLGVIAGALAVAVWALRDPVAAKPPAVDPGPPALLLKVQRRGGRFKTTALRGGGVLGRHADCAVVVEQPTVSKHHARIRYDDGGAWLEDLHSTNGTYVNGHRIETALLRRGDRIALGAAKIVFLGVARRH